MEELVVRGALSVDGRRHLPDRHRSRGSRGATGSRGVDLTARGSRSADGRGRLPRSQRPQRCPLCGLSVTIRLRRHLEAVHFPWFLHPSLCCWTCRAAFPTLNLVQRFHGATQDGHNEQSLLTDDNLRRWGQLVRGYLRYIGRLVGCATLEELLIKVRRNHWYPPHHRNPSDGGVLAARMLDVMYGSEDERRDLGYRVSPPSRTSVLVHCSIVTEILGNLSLQQVQTARRFITEDRVVMMSEPPCSVVDAHCHVERILRETGHQDVGHLYEDVVLLSNDEEEAIHCSHILCSLAYPSSWQALASLSEADAMFFQVGLHPRIANSPVTDRTFDRLVDMSRHPKCIAIGEVGLDYQCQPSPQERRNQTAFLRRVADFADFRGLPMVIHARLDSRPSEVYIDVLNLLRQHLRISHPVYIHCFMGTLTDARMWLMRFPQTYFGFGRGIANSSPEVDQLLRDIPQDRILVETDAPYMLPHPWALRSVVNRVALVRNLTPRMVCELARLNAMRFFQLPYRE